LITGLHILHLSTFWQENRSFPPVVKRSGCGMPDSLFHCSKQVVHL